MLLVSDHLLGRESFGHEAALLAVLRIIVVDHRWLSESVRSRALGAREQLRLAFRPHHVCVCQQGVGIGVCVSRDRFGCAQTGKHIVWLRIPGSIKEIDPHADTIHLDASGQDVGMSSSTNTLKETLKADLTTAMKARAEVEVSTLRMALAAVTNAEVAGDEAVQLTDDQVVKVLQAEVKKRSEAAEVYEQAGRAESAAKERAELAVLERYLPAAMSDDELAVIVHEEVAKAAAAGQAGGKAMGMVVKAVRERAGSAADGGKIAALVKAALG